MAKKKKSQGPQYVSGEAFTEEQQIIGKQAPSLDGYDPIEYDDDVAQMRQPQGQPQFLDLSDPSKLARPESQQTPPQGYPPQGQFQAPQGQFPPQQGGYPQQQYQQPIQPQMPVQESTTPDLFNADARLDELDGIMDKVNAVAQGTDANGKSTQQYAIGIALKSLKDSVKMLEEVDYWIPQGKEKYAPQLKKIAAPIAKALRAYVASVDKLK